MPPITIYWAAHLKVKRWPYHPLLTKAKPLISTHLTLAIPSKFIRGFQVKALTAVRLCPICLWISRRMAEFSKYSELEEQWIEISLNM